MLFSSHNYFYSNVKRSLYLMPIRIQRRIERDLFYRRMKRKYLRIDSDLLSQNIKTDGGSIWADRCVLPGNTLEMPWMNGSLWKQGFYINILQNVFNHRLPILSSESYNLNLIETKKSENFFNLTKEFHADFLDSYVRINWHCDFKSQYQWEPSQFYLDVKFGHVSGVDIKVPRELSRFQHISPLACGELEKGGIEFLLEVLDWIDANPAYRGVNWACTMDVALRVVNWIWGLQLFQPVILKYPLALNAIVKNIHLHGRHIENNLEYYEENTNNHYLSDITGLIYIGASFPQFEESDRWLLFGIQELVSEMFREVYNDGFAHEASTNYHRFVAELFASSASLIERIPISRRTKLTAVDRKQHHVKPPLRSAVESGLNLGSKGSVLPSEFYERLARMAELTAVITKPNGLVPQFGDNDSARVHKLHPNLNRDSRDHRHVVVLIGELTGRNDLKEIGSLDDLAEAQLISGDLHGKIAMPAPHISINAQSFLFPNAGIAVCKLADIYLAVTCGTNGLGGRGGHGHNDKLSFELNINGHDIIVDGGCPFYTSFPEIRNRYRSTSAHNTIFVVNKEQDKWPVGQKGLFSLPERSKPQLWIEHDGVIVGQHSGYGALHKRRFLLKQGQLIIEDKLVLKTERRINFNFDSTISCQIVDYNASQVNCILLSSSGIVLNLVIKGASSPLITDGCLSIGYGIPVSNQSLNAIMVQDIMRTEILWHSQ